MKKYPQEVYDFFRRKYLEAMLEAYLHALLSPEEEEEGEEDED